MSVVGFVLFELDHPAIGRYNLSTGTPPSTPEPPPPYQPAGSHEPLHTDHSNFSSAAVAKNSRLESLDGIELGNVYRNIQNVAGDTEANLPDQPVQRQQREDPDPPPISEESLNRFLMYCVFPFTIWIWVCLPTLWLPRTFCHPPRAPIVVYATLPLAAIAIWLLGTRMYVIDGTLFSDNRRLSLKEWVVLVCTVVLLTMGWLTPCLIVPRIRGSR